MKSKHRKLRNGAILIGFDAKGRCVYSDAMSVSDYYDGEHVWDSAAKTKKLKIAKLRGYLFDPDGKLLQEFESNFSLKTGLFKNGYARHEDGTVQHHG